MRAAVAVFSLFFLFACSSEAPPPDNSETADTESDQIEESAEMDEYALEYQERVRKKTSGFVVKSLAKDWGISEDKVRCLMQGVPLEKFEVAQTDPEVLAVFEECGVDPAVVEE